MPCPMRKNFVEFFLLLLLLPPLPLHLSFNKVYMFFRWFSAIPPGCFSRAVLLWILLFLLCCSGISLFPLDPFRKMSNALLHLMSIYKSQKEIIYSLFDIPVYTQRSQATKEAERKKKQNKSLSVLLKPKTVVLHICLL